MKLIPDRYLPNFLRSDIKAVNEFKKSVAKKRNINQTLNRQRQYVAEMKQDEFKLAMEWAKDPLRPRRHVLLEMYQAVWDMDGHCIGEVGKAINKVVGAPFAVFDKKSGEIDESATRLLQKSWFEKYRTHKEEARFFGHSLVQFLDMVPSTEEGIKFEFRKIELIDRQHVRPEEGFIVLDTSHEVGVPFRDESVRSQLNLIEFGEPRDLGVLLVATKEFIWKNYSRSDWSRHSEKFGMPFLMLKLATTDEKEIDAAENMAKNFGSNLYYIGDPEDEIDIKESTFKDSFQMYKEKALFCNDEISKAFTWQTGTSDEKAFVGGAEVHERVLNDYVEARKRSQMYHINEELFPFLIENGYPLQGKEFKYYIPEDQQQEDMDNAEQKGNGKGKGQGGGPAKKPQQPKGLFR